MQREGEAAQSDGRVTPHSPDAAAQATPDKNCPITQGDAASILTTALNYSHTFPGGQSRLPHQPGRGLEQEPKPRTLVASAAS